MKEKVRLLRKKILRKVPDSIYLRFYYKKKMHQKLNLKNPKTFNEKLQWLKLHDRNPLYTTLVDKYKVREYIKNNLGEEYLIPIIGVYDSFDEIDFGELPNKFVMKCNHDSASVIVCKNKKELDIESAREKLEKALNRNFYYGGREWAYKNVKPKIIIEKFMEDKKGLLLDYKFYCFNGKSDYVMICANRDKGKTNFFYLNRNGELMRNMTNDGIEAPKNFKVEVPDNLEEMFNIVCKLSKDIPFVRIDLYNVDGRIYFGEFTFYPSGGFDAKRLEETDRILSSRLDIKSLKGRK